MAQHGPNLPRTPGPEQFGNVTVRYSGPNRYQLNNGQHRLHILHPH